MNSFINTFVTGIGGDLGGNMNRYGLRKLPRCLLLAVTCFLCSANALANESYCHSIQNADKRNVCLAVAKGQQSYCHSVQESDARNMCLAMVTRQTSYCHSIGSSDSRNFCLGTSR